MKFFHLADLHIGKTVNGFSMLEDQRYLFDQILGLLRQHQPDAVVVAGDVYDRTSPTAEAVTLFDSFLCALHDEGTRVLMVAGNHDSPQRLACAGAILAREGVHIAGVFEGTARRVEADGAAFTLLPYLRASAVRALYPDEPVESLADAVRLVLAQTPPLPGYRNVLVAHQFVVNGGSAPERSDSETLSVGGADAIDAALLNGYDYVALGHIHKPQPVGGDTVRYAGSPLKYSFSERSHQKSIPLVELGETGPPRITLLPLSPRRELRQITGGLDEILMAAGLEVSEDYIRAVLTDELPIPDAALRLRRAYPNLMELAYDNLRTRSEGVSRGPLPQGKSQIELFVEFYTLQNGAPPDDGQMQMLQSALRKAGGAS